MPTHIREGYGNKRLLVKLRFLISNKNNRMACFDRSKCFTQGVNLVATRNIDYQTLFEPEELHRKMEAGYIIDFKSLDAVVNSKPNVGSQYFQLVKET